MTRFIVRATCAGLLAALSCIAVRAEPPAGCATSAAGASPATLAQRQSATRDARDHGFLWRITRAGRRSWLYGTLHLGRFEWTVPGPRTAAALRASDTVALELDLHDPLIQRRFADALAASHAGAFASAATLPPDLRERLQRRVEADCLPWDGLRPMPPELVLSLLTSRIARDAGLDPAYGIDDALGDWARRARRPVLSLETPESQLQALLPVDDREALASAAGSLDALENGQVRTLALRVAGMWADADWAGLSGYESWCGCVDTEADRAAAKRLLDDRNPGLADAIDALHASGKRVFAAVGSLHMIGPNGLPALLARRGYRVEQVVPEQQAVETKP